MNEVSWENFLRKFKLQVGVFYKTKVFGGPVGMTFGLVHVLLIV